MRILITIFLLFISSIANAKILYHWTQLAPENKLLARMIIDYGSCPKLHTNKGQFIMQERSLPDFPSKVCESLLDFDVTKAVADNHVFPLPKKTFKRIVIIGDTGCGRDTDTQNCSKKEEWPFAEIAKFAAKENPDLIIHTGDIHYRAKQMGFGFDSFKADFFAPASPLLAKAPILMIHGNHEDCTHAWMGWNNYFAIGKIQEKCEANFDSHLYKFHDLNMIVMNTAFLPDHGLQEEMADSYSNSLKNILDNLQSIDRNNLFLITHKPAWTNGYISEDFKGKYEFNETLSKTFKNLDLSKIGLILNGHVHLFQLISFTDLATPPEMIVGNGGNQLLTDILLKEYEKTMDGKDISSFFSMQKFGYAVMDKEKNSWKTTIKDANNKIINICHIDNKKVNCAL